MSTQKELNISLTLDIEQAINLSGVERDRFLEFVKSSPAPSFKFRKAMQDYLSRTGEYN